MLLWRACAIPRIGATRAPATVVTVPADRGAVGVSGTRVGDRPKEPRREPTVLERPGDLRTKSERMGLVVSEMMGLEMMLPKEEVERVSLRASRSSSSSPACFLERLRLRKTQAMKATAAVTRTAPTAAPAITAVGVPPPPVLVSGLEDGLVFGAVVVTGNGAPVEVLLEEEEGDAGDEVGITWMLLVDDVVVGVTVDLDREPELAVGDAVDEAETDSIGLGF